MRLCAIILFCVILYVHLIVFCVRRTVEGCLPQTFLRVAFSFFIEGTSLTDLSTCLAELDGLPAEESMYSDVGDVAWGDVQEVRSK